MMKMPQGWFDQAKVQFFRPMPPSVTPLEQYRPASPSFYPVKPPPVPQYNPATFAHPAERRLISCAWNDKNMLAALILLLRQARANAGVVNALVSRWQSLPDNPSESMSGLGSILRPYP